jgi:haloalkane dehalogenase
MEKQPNWLNKDLYPFKSNCHQLTMGKMHYLDEGEGNPILFLHGTPTWSFLYRKLIKELSTTNRCIAPDHIGFGLSDKPETWEYNIRDHTKNLDSLLEKLNLDNITLVIHDFGGPIGFPWALENVDKISKIILFNTWMWSQEEEAIFKKNKKILQSKFFHWIYKKFNFSARFLIKEAAGNDDFLTPEIKKHYIKPFDATSERMGTIGFLDSLLYENEYFDNVFSKMDVLRETPTLILWGMKDKYISKNYLARWKNFFTNRSILKFEASGHWVMEEEPERTMREIKEFLK